MLDHLIAVLAFAGVCAALYGVQRLAGDDAAEGCAAGAPGCRGGCRGEVGTCPDGAAEADVSSRGRPARTGADARTE